MRGTELLTLKLANGALIHSGHIVIISGYNKTEAIKRHIQGRSNHGLFYARQSLIYNERTARQQKTRMARIERLRGSMSILTCFSYHRSFIITITIVNEDFPPDSHVTKDLKCKTSNLSLLSFHRRCPVYIVPVMPPLTEIHCAVIQRLLSDTRRSTASAISSVVPTRSPARVCATKES